MTPPLTDAIAVAMAQLVDDAQTDRRDPSHDDLGFQIERAGLAKYDPRKQGQGVGKAKRLRIVLSCAIEYDLAAGCTLVEMLLALLRGRGGFRADSPNYVTEEAIKSAIDVFAAEGYDLSLDGELRPQILEGASKIERLSALRSYARRAQRGVTDAALVSGTGKDLLEATAAHIVQGRYGHYSQTANFQALLGQAFLALDMATPKHAVDKGESPTRAMERSMFKLACDINKLRNKEGTGHGRPRLTRLSATEAKTATEFMGVIAEYMLNRQGESTP